MADINMTMPELVEALPKLWQINPLALEQMKTFILESRLTKANAEIRRLSNQAQEDGRDRQEVIPNAGNPDR